MSIILLGAVIRPLPANTRHRPNAVLMLGQCRRRWTNIKTTLGQCLVFVGLLVTMLTRPTRNMQPIMIFRTLSPSNPIFVSFIFDIFFIHVPLSAQSLQHRDRGNPEVGTMPYFHRMTRLCIVHSTIDSTAHCRPLNRPLEHCICTTSMTNIRPGRDSSPALSFEPQPDQMSH